MESDVLTSTTVPSSTANEQQDARSQEEEWTRMLERAELNGGEDRRRELQLRLEERRALIDKMRGRTTLVLLDEAQHLRESEGHNAQSGEVSGPLGPGTISGGNPFQQEGHEDSSPINNGEVRWPTNNPLMPFANSPALVEAALKSLEFGTVAFATPDAMVLEKPEIVSLSISPLLSAEELTSRLSDRLPTARVESDRIELSSSMRVELLGEGDFTISPLKPAQQSVRAQEPTEWSWKVTPIRSGDQWLHVNVYAVVNVPDKGREVEVIIKTFERKIPIRVSMVQRATFFVRDHWQWSFASLLIPLVSFVKERFQRQTGDQPHLRFGQRLRRRRGLA